ncbi:hypothetical protein CTAYLR_002766 [Chrysophaeum taylorii]|uniref:Ammonium transporter AmtB-like domain-containing protein n=1 Tax=Chrysophaeum taylorii TaxID=2483200 RepID=A0AAD7UBQ6_9STRA|nr:hypothetical protein CTAYLR_002766 [Chrysophaeum taylorii]
MVRLWWYLAAVAATAANEYNIDVEKLAARVRELEAVVSHAGSATIQEIVQEVPADVVSSQKKAASNSGSRRSLGEIDVESVNMGNPQDLGAARRTSFHYHSMRHRIMKERQERRYSQGRRLDEAVSFDEFCWSLDNVWVVVAGLICFFLQGGFAMLESGGCRAKNAKNILLKNLMDACVGGLVYYVFGWGLAHGGETTNEKGAPDGKTFLGDGQFMLLPHRNIEAYGYHLFFFNYVFAATIATIVSGAVAERIQFRAYMIYSVILTGFVYPICSHWIWSPDGFLYRAGVVDFAGGGAVHALSGVAALMGAMALGPREGYFGDDGKVKGIKAHDMALMAIGLFIFWFGFIPFNSGSGLSMCGYFAANLTSRIAVITTIGGCSGGIVSLLWGVVVEGYSSLEYALVGTLAGMVAVCSCCAVVDVWAIFWIISPLGVASYWACEWARKKCMIDDPLGASSLHFGPGAVGMIAVGFFASPRFISDVYLNGWDGAKDRCADMDGLTEVPDGDENVEGDFIFYKYRKNDGCRDFYGIFFGGSGKQLGWQIVALGLFTIWGVVTCFFIFYPMKWLGILRVSLEDERVGIDIVHHGGPCYEWYSPVSALPEAHVEKALPVPETVEDENKENEDEP